LGDEIISHAVRTQLTQLFPRVQLLNASSRDYGRNAKNSSESSTYTFFGGTNALSADPVFGYRQFLDDKYSAFRMQNVILLGVGWWQYQNSFGKLAKQFYKNLLRDDVQHSVRDGHTAAMLAKLGFENIINTGCPTMWDLASFTADIPDRAVVTLTDYHRNPERDLVFLSRALDVFDQVAYWPQGSGDIDYIGELSQSIDLSRIEILPPSVQAFDAALAEGRAFAGTRLHACIRALQRKNPAFLIAVDNRAKEISRSDKLPLIDPALPDLMVGNEFSFNYIRRPEIDQFLLQFRT
jgi:polysaccharide pyruvyl transferase WcaK-like protein